MTESDYVLVSNLAKFRIADTILRDVFHGDEHGVPPEEYANLMVLGFNMIQRLAEKVEAITEG